MLIREHTLQLHTVENQAWAQVPEQSTGTGLLGRNASPHLSEGRTGAAVAGNGASLEHVRQGLRQLGGTILACPYLGTSAQIDWRLAWEVKVLAHTQHWNSAATVLESTEAVLKQY